MAGNEDSKLAAVAQRWRRQVPDHLARRVNRRVAGDVDFARNDLRTKIGCRQPRRGEQQTGASIDRRSKLLLRPRQPIVRAQARFHVRDGHVGPEAGDRTGQGGACVSLHDEQVGLTIKSVAERPEERCDMCMRIGLPSALQRLAVEGAQAEFIRVEPVLAGQNYS